MANTVQVIRATCTLNPIIACHLLRYKSSVDFTNRIYAARGVPRYMFFQRVPVFQKIGWIDSPTLPAPIICN